MVNRLALDALGRDVVLLRCPHVGDERSVRHADGLDCPAQVDVPRDFRVHPLRHGQVFDHRLDPFITFHVRRVNPTAHHHGVAVHVLQLAVHVERCWHDVAHERSAAHAVVLQQPVRPAVSTGGWDHVRLHQQERLGVAHLAEGVHNHGEVVVAGHRGTAGEVAVKRMDLGTQLLGHLVGSLFGG